MNLIWENSYMLNIYSLILLLILLFTMIFKRETYRYSSRLLQAVIIATSALLLIEILSWTFDGIDTPVAKTFNYIFNYLFFIAGGFNVGLFASYADYLVTKDKKRLKRRFYYQHVFLLFIVMAIINIFTPIVFSISPENVYQREPWMTLAFIAVFAVILHILGITFYNRKKTTKEVFFSIYVFSLIPVIGAVLQMFIFGLLIMWAFVGLSVVIAYIFTETINSSKDYLSKLYTRAITEEYINRLLEQNNTFCVLMFDMDQLKQINDTYGHKEGDNAIVAFSQGLKKSFPKQALISRYGGDEFLVVLKQDCIKMKESSLQALEEFTAQFEETNHPLRFSVGDAKRLKNDSKTMDDLLVEADKALYQNKTINKSKLEMK